VAFAGLGRLCFPCVSCCVFVVRGIAIPVSHAPCRTSRHTATLRATHVQVQEGYGRASCVAILAKVLATNCDGQTLLLEVRYTSSTAKTAEFLKKLLHDAVLRASPGGVSGCITDTAASCQRGGLRVSGPPASPCGVLRRGVQRKTVCDRSGVSFFLWFLVFFFLPVSLPPPSLPPSLADSLPPSPFLPSPPTFFAPFLALSLPAFFTSFFLSSPPSFLSVKAVPVHA
jgi:hypothetical protein